MKYSFDKESIELISDILGGHYDVVDNCYSWTINSQLYNSRIVVNLYVNILPNNTNSISVQTPAGYFELHNIDCWDKFFEEEIVFFATNDSHLFSIFISKENGISFYANIDKVFLDTNIDKVDPSLLLAIMQLNIYNKYKAEN